MKSNWIKYLGFLIPIVFWLTNFICGFLIPNYNHAEHLVSELGEIGSPSQSIFTFALVTCSLLSLIFIICLVKVAKPNRINLLPIVLILLYSFSIFCAGIFPYPTKLHSKLGSPAVFLFLSPLSGIFLWNKIERVKIFSAIALIFMLLGFSVYSQNILPQYFGIKQRLFHFGWTFWFVYLGLAFSKLSLRISLNSPATNNG